MNKISAENAVNEFKNGKIGIFPTDTAFGIGCIIDDDSAVEKLFSIRRRPHNKPTPILVNSLGMAEDITRNTIPNEVRGLTKKYWPGGLTLVLPNSNEGISTLVTGGTKTLGIRMPDHKNVLKIITELGRPILAPSANFSGESTPFSFNEINLELLALVDFCVEGECLGKSTSTVLDCTKKPYMILRQGVVKIDQDLL